MRKELITILGLFGLILACNSGMESDAMKSTEAAESEMTVSTDEIDKDEEASIDMDAAINYEVIASQKLMEFADLRNLMTKHPEFKADLTNQLLNFSSDSLLLKENDIIEISGIRVLEHKIVNDSLTKVKMDFTIKTPDGSVRDSILAIFRFDAIELEGQIFNSTKVTFESLRD